MTARLFFLLTCGLFLTSCGGNPYLDASLKPAELEGKSQEWFLENWGEPNSKAQRFFGGETWTYFRIAGGKKSFPFGNFSPNECEITLDFDEEKKLEDSGYSDC